MTHFNKYLLLLVRTDGDVSRAWREVGAFLVFQRARLPTVHEEHERWLIGMWVDPLMVDVPPEALGCPPVSGHHPFRIRESIGLSGIWRLCWLDADLGPGAADPGAIRQFLISALSEEQRLRQRPPTRQFTPVFDADDRCSLIHLQTDRLRGLFPGLIGEPVTWNRTTGAMATLSRNGKGARQH